MNDPDETKLNLVTRFILDINAVKDLNTLLERALFHIRQVCNADGGSIFLKEGDKLYFSYAQNATLQSNSATAGPLIHQKYSLLTRGDSIAGYVGRENTSVNIPDVYALTGEEPYSFNPEFDILSSYRTCSVLALPLNNQQNKVIGVLELINRMDNDGRAITFSSSDEHWLRYLATTTALAIERAKMTRNVIMRMIRMVQLHDPTETGAHANRVGAYTAELYERIAAEQNTDVDATRNYKDLLRLAAMLHDVGKIGVDDRILKKPSKLDESEYEEMKRHADLGATLFDSSQSDLDELAAQIAVNHHERWDGKGYPAGKKGEEIPLAARLASVADVFDALRSKRCYREAWDEQTVLAEIEKESGTKFDPEAVQTLFNCLDDFRDLELQYPEDKDMPRLSAT